jgi:hypothetical protein
MAADGPSDGEGGGTTTVNIEVDSIEEAERVFAALAEGGKVEMPMTETSGPIAGASCTTATASRGWSTA